MDKSMRSIFRKWIRRSDRNLAVATIAVYGGIVLGAALLIGGFAELILSPAWRPF